MNKRESTYYIRIGGIYCDHCKTIIRQSLLEIEGVKSVHISGNVAITCADIPIRQLIDCINQIGYYTEERWICRGWNKWKLLEILQLCLSAGVVLGIRYVLLWWMGYDLLNVIPTIDSSVTLGMLFVTGLLTSVHCVGMCGAINLVASQDKRSAAVYNAGRILVYTLVGVMIGAIGNVLRIDTRIVNVFSLIVALLMLLMGLSMTGLFSFSSKCCFPIQKKRHSAFVLGLLNGFMPCSPLIAMQLYAMSTGSPLWGGLSMFLFGLGTVPLMLGIGLIRELFERKKEQVQKNLAVLIVLLAYFMVIRSLSALGFHPVTQKAKLSDYIVTEIGDDYQMVQAELSYSSYGNIAVKKGIPVIFTILAEDEYLTECNNAIVSTDFDFSVSIHPGENVINFTPEEEGVFVYTCWMNMIKNKIYVYE
ncbi:MAG: sulfite exporter TauE/SafE family protein [Lachnospiraceae bacterium]|nr:sulfite exporter TauE/SafE family protein [Lachnospiraceae bacterium]